MADYIFGYGSLISTESRLKSGETNECVPVRVTNLRRGWNLPVPTYFKGRGIVGLGATESSFVSCNGVLFKPQDIKDFKAREEKYGYIQSPLNKSDLIFLNQALSLSAVDSLWYFSPKKPGSPSKVAPIRQYYLDECLTGCLEYSEDFAREFLRTTHVWKFWINDRINPAYEHKISFVDTETIDKLLAEHFGSELDSLRKDE